jgi:hypothetical protein
MEALLEKEGTVESWNDERLDELSRRMDIGFKEMREGFDRLGQEMREGFVRVDNEMREGFARVDTEMKEGFARVDTEMKEGFLHAAKRNDQTNQRIDRLMLVNLSGALGIIGTLIVIAAS